MSLNPEQQLVVDSILTHKKIVVTAAAGSGKSRTLLASFTKASEAFPASGFSIVTYTQAAAAELSKRIQDQNLPEPGFVGTLHSLMLKQLRAEGHRIGLRNVSVADERTTLAALRESMKRVGWKDSLERAKKAIASKDSSTKEAMLFNDFHGRLAQDGLVTFDGILALGRQLLEKTGGAVPFTHLMVDEYQDVSRADHELYLKMAVQFRFVVSDPRQAIFGFRGGDPTCIHELLNDPSWSKFQLSTNYRSTPEIIITANRLAPKLPIKDKMVPVSLELLVASGAIVWMDGEKMADLKPRWERSLAQERGGTGIDIFDCVSEETQLEAIEDFLSENEGTPCAIICRYNWQIAYISEHLRKKGISHQRSGVCKKPPGWDAAQALIGFLGNPESETMAFSLISVVHSEAQAIKMRRLANERFMQLGRLIWADEIPPLTDLEEVLERYNLDPVTMQVVMGIHDKLSIMDRSWTALAAAMADPAALHQEIADSKVPLLCTIHASKGREFDSVLLPYWSDQLFPGNRQAGEDEEWRLAYVAITRARTNLCICSVAESRRYPEGQPEPMNRSRFINQIEK
jgi:superfamily I DNA/RNA helicase